MPDVPWDYDAFLDEFVAWAEERENLRGVVVLGSRARVCDDPEATSGGRHEQRTEKPADEWSDLDLLLVTTDPQQYLDETDWLAELGEVWLTFREPTATGDRTERRALFAPGLDVDFVPIPAADVETAAAEGSATLAHGYRIVYDEVGLEDTLAEAEANESPSSDLPRANEFHETCADFWYHAVWTAKKLRRGEIWTAKSCLDGYVKWECLLPMLGWHAIVHHDREPWHEGRFLESWADDRALADLGDAFADYDAGDPDDCWRALFETIDLFGWLAEETATKLGYDFPIEGLDRVEELITNLHAGRERP